ncbi:MAG: signal peptidase II, partial [Oscillospiraceae bacterium]
MTASKRSFWQNNLRFIAIAFSILLIVFDQFIKKIAIEKLQPKSSIPVIKGFFHFTYVENTGAAFGVMDGRAGILILITSLAILVATFLILFKRIKKPFLIWTISLIIAGGVGNLIDRIGKGYVVDYLDLRVINFAVFNFADCCVVIGTILLMLYILFSKNETSLPLTDDDFNEDETD